jgi:hypothetical protein
MPGDRARRMASTAFEVRGIGRMALRHGAISPAEARSPAPIGFPLPARRSRRPAAGTCAPRSRPLQARWRCTGNGSGSSHGSIFTRRRPLPCWQRSSGRTLANALSGGRTLTGSAPGAYPGAGAAGCRGDLESWRISWPPASESTSRRRSLRRLEDQAHGVLDGGRAERRVVHFSLPDSGAVLGARHQGVGF